MLGHIYYYVEKDIQKAIHYFTLASIQHFVLAQYYLGMIYIENIYINQNINKSIYYFTLSANQNYYKSQFILGVLYSQGLFVKKDMIKAIDYFIQSSTNFDGSSFIVVYFYQEGKYVEKDILKSINYYKNASSFNNQYAKNNLGIIYKYGYEKKIEKNIGLSITYFKEAIQQKYDIVALYNLAHIYIYEIQSEKSIDDSINLLLGSSLQFYESVLLCIALIKKHGFNIDKIQKELNEKINWDHTIVDSVCKMIKCYGLFREQFDDVIEYFKEVDFLYTFTKNVIITKSLNEKEVTGKVKTCKNITAEFYEGFGVSI